MEQLVDSKEDAQLLIATIDHWLNGLPAAEEATWQDESIEDVNQMLVLVGDYPEQRRRLLLIRGRLLDAFCIPR